MTTLLLFDHTNPECVISAPRRARTRLWARLHASRLDRALAAGASPDSSAALSLRAGELISAGARARLARSIHKLLDDARRSSLPRGPVVVCRRKVRAAKRTLEKLADRLCRDPVDARGVAQIRLLLTERSGPLYDRPAADDLEPALRAAMAALEPTA